MPSVNKLALVVSLTFIMQAASPAWSQDRSNKDVNDELMSRRGSAQGTIGGIEALIALFGAIGLAGEDAALKHQKKIQISQAAKVREANALAANKRAAELFTSIEEKDSLLGEYRAWAFSKAVRDSTHDVKQVEELEKFTHRLTDKEFSRLYSSRGFSKEFLDWTRTSKVTHSQELNLDELAAKYIHNLNEGGVSTFGRPYRSFQQTSIVSVAEKESMIRETAKEMEKAAEAIDAEVRAGMRAFTRVRTIAIVGEAILILDIADRVYIYNEGRDPGVFALGTSFSHAVAELGKTMHVSAIITKSKSSYLAIYNNVHPSAAMTFKPIR